MTSACSDPNNHSYLRAPLPQGEEVTPIMQDMFDFQSKLFQWRKTEPVLHFGKTMHFLSRDNTYAFFRYTDTDAVFVFINNALEERTLDWNHYREFVEGPVTGRNVITGEEITLQDGVVVPEKSSLIVEFKR